MNTSLLFSQGIHRKKISLVFTQGDLQNLKVLMLYPSNGCGSEGSLPLGPVSDAGSCGCSSEG